MRRTELFEIHDHPWFPAFLRDLVTDALQALWCFSNSYKPILPLLQNTLARVGHERGLDLCSGGGGPWFKLVRDFESEQHSSDQRLLDGQVSKSGGVSRVHSRGPFQRSGLTRDR